MSKQITINIEGAVTITVPDNFDRDIDSIPITIDVMTSDEIDDSIVEEVNETDIFTREIISEVDL